MTSLPRLSALFAVLLLFGLSVSSAHAQRTSGAFGIGCQVGEPSGITFKVYNAGAPSYDLLAAWSGVNDFFFVNGHVLFENRISASNVDQPLEWFIGPGAFVGAFSGNGNDDDGAIFGISGTAGLQILLANHFELYIQATPRFAVIPETEGDLGGGLGLRYYF